MAAKLGPAQPAPRIMIVTASDSRFMPFLRGMLASLAGWLRQDRVSLACFDIGLAEPDRVWLAAQGAHLLTARAHLGADATAVKPALLSFLARPFLPEYLPGHDVYVWIDSDVWLQDDTVLDSYIEGALATGMAITHERTASYRFQPWLLGWTTKHFALGYGLLETAYLLTQRHVNAGFFAIRAGAPHWAAWAECYQAAIARTGALVPHDQFALNQAIHGGITRKTSLAVTLLPPVCNWICDRGVPMWHDQARAFCDPRPPFTPIRALHLAGPAKRERYDIRRTGGGSFSTCPVHGASPDAPRPSPLVAA
jgi:hypothetical protein